MSSDLQRPMTSKRLIDRLWDLKLGEKITRFMAPEESIENEFLDWLLIPPRAVAAVLGVLLYFSVAFLVASGALVGRSIGLLIVAAKTLRSWVARALRRWRR